MNMGSIVPVPPVAPATGPAQRPFAPDTAATPQALPPAPGTSAAAGQAPRQPFTLAEPETKAQPAAPPREPQTALRIEYNVDAGRFVYLSSDPRSGETVSQIPTEEALRRIAWLREQLDARRADGRD